MLHSVENFLMNHFAWMEKQFNLSKTGNFMGQHILVPKEGVAIHINAFNFPVWGCLKKLRLTYWQVYLLLLNQLLLLHFLQKLL